MIRVALRTLARVDGEMELQVEGSVTQLSVLAALEARHPVLRGTIPRPRHAATPTVLRFFACEQDLSHELPPDTLLPDTVAMGAEPFLIVGAMAGD